MRFYQILAGVGGVVGLLIEPAGAVDYMRGKVTMDDGSAPPSPALIQRDCPGAGPVTDATTSKQGRYLWRVSNSPYLICTLQAVLPGYVSNKIDLSLDRLYLNIELPTLVLHKVGVAETEKGFKLPASAMSSWNLALKAAEAKNWKEAERQLRATLRAAPQFAPAWNALGAACQNQQKMDAARDAYRRGIEADPELLLARHNLTHLELGARNWPEAARAADGLIRADWLHQYPEAYLDGAIARYAMHDLDGVEATLNPGLALDSGHQFPRLEFFKAAVLWAKGDRQGSIDHLKLFLDQAPGSPDAAPLRAFLESAQSAPPEAFPTQAQADAVAENAETSLPGKGEEWVPGGMTALAAIAHLKDAPARETFFLEYCTAIANETSKTNYMRTPGYQANLGAYMIAVAELSRLGENRGDKTLLTLSLADPLRAAKTRQILNLFGWKLEQQDGVLRPEPGDASADGPRQQVMRAFGIDEVAMEQTLEAGKSFPIEIAMDSATLNGGVAWWGAMAKEFSSLPGGIAEALVRDPQLAKTYAALARMPADAANAFVGRSGLRALATESADALWLYSDSFSISSGAVAVPGGADAVKVWTKLAGVDSRNTRAFLHAIIVSGHGRLAAFYSALAHADAAHQRFFTRNPTRATKFYTWYRDSNVREGITRPGQDWRATFFQKVPLDGAGNVRFPGGKATWANPAASDEDALLHLKALHSLVVIAELEEKRGARFDDASAKLLARHFDEWSALFPYFEILPSLSRADFEALEAFSKVAAGYRKPRQNAVMGEWHSLMALIVLGRKAGSLDADAGAAAFRHACEGLLAEDYSAKALAVLREIGGGDAPNLDEGIAGHLLRLGGEKRDAFERVRELQGTPKLADLGAHPEPSDMVEAMAGLVYGAIVSPDSLLIGEDPTLIRRHQYLTDRCGACSSTSPENMNLFKPASVYRSTDLPGSRVIGGFMRFDDVASNLVSGGKAISRLATVRPPASPDQPVVPTEATFRAAANLVQVFATVTDSRGRYLDDLDTGDFTILNDGTPARISAFEPGTAGLSCTLLLDTSESMLATLPALKKAALKFIGGLRPNDSVAVYTLRGGITELEPFTTDKRAAERAVLKTEPGGMTALYDGLVRVIRDISDRPGKKAIVVFTDGDDNISLLPSDTAIQRARNAGVPVYTIAKGTDIQEQTLQQLASVSRSTGGISIKLEGSSGIQAAFETIFQDVMHGYLLAFQAPDSAGHVWHTIEVVLKSKGRKVKARDGYYPE